MWTKLSFGGNWLMYGFYIILIAVSLPVLLLIVIFLIKITKAIWKSISEEKITQWALSVWRKRFENIENIEKITGKFSVIAFACITAAVAVASIYLTQKIFALGQLPQFLSNHEYLKFIIIGSIILFTYWQCFIVYRSYVFIRGEVKKIFPLFVTTVILAILVLGLLATKLLPSIFSTASLGDITSFLAAILAFIGVTNYLLYEINRRDIEAKTKNIEFEMMESSNARAHNLTAYALWIYHRSLEENSKHNCENFKTVHPIENPGADDGKKLIDYAIDMANKGVASSAKLDPIKYDELICACKNNLAFYLATRNKENDKEAALLHGEYIYRVASDKKRSAAFVDSWAWKATWAFVLLMCSENNELSTKKVYKILDGIKNDPAVKNEVLKTLRFQWEFAGGKGNSVIANALEYLFRKND